MQVTSIIRFLAVQSQSVQSSICRACKAMSVPSAVFLQHGSQWIQSSVNETYSPPFACNIQSVQAAVFVQRIKQVSSIHSLSATFSHFNLQFSCNLEKLFRVHISIYIIIITIIKVDNFCIALFSGVPKLTVLYNILEHFLSFTNIIHIIITTNNVYYYLPLIPSLQVPTPTWHTRTHTHRRKYETGSGMHTCTNQYITRLLCLDKSGTRMTASNRKLRPKHIKGSK